MRCSICGEMIKSSVAFWLDGPAHWSCMVAKKMELEMDRRKRIDTFALAPWDTRNNQLKKGGPYGPHQDSKSAYQ